MPGVDRRLLEGTAATWTEVFLEATEQNNLVRRYPELQREDFDRLAAAAVRGLGTAHPHLVCARIAAFSPWAGRRSA